MTRLRHCLRSCGILLAAPLALHLSRAPDAEEPSEAPSCATTAHAAFDFWLGEWNVLDSVTGKLAGVNRIERMDNGCVVRERYQTPGAYTGQSLNWYDPALQRWHQLWLDSDGLILRLVGGVAPDGSMILEGAGRDSVGPTIERIAWQLRSNGTVRQHWTQARTPAGPWRTVFDGIYERRAP